MKLKTECADSRFLNRRGTVALTPGENYLYEGRVIRLINLRGMDCDVEDIATLECNQTRISELYLPPKQPHRNNIGRPDTVSNSEWKRAQKVAAMIALLSGMAPNERTNKKLDELGRSLGIKHRQVRRIFRRGDENQSVMSAVRRKRGPKNNSRRLAVDLERIISESITSHERKKESWTLKSLHREIEKRCAGKKAPCERTIARRLEARGIDLQTRRRHGRAKAMEIERPKLKTYDVALPLHQIQIDHTRVDVMVYDSFERLKLRRPWLTLVIDSCTRVVLGFHLSFDSPSITSTSLALLCAIRGKQQLLKDCGLATLRWDVWGRPKEVLTDSGSDFKSKAFTRGCESNHIKPNLRPLGEKNWGGRIERLIGTTMGAMHMLPGTTFSCPKHRDGYDSESKAMMELGGLRAWVVAQIVEYHNTLHRDLHRTPYQEWMHRLTTADGTFVPPPLVDDLERVEKEFLPSKLRQVRGNHINFDNRPYQNDVLLFFAQGEKTDIFYHPDPGRRRVVYVKDKNNVFHTLTTTQPPKRDISMSEECAIIRAKRAASAADEMTSLQRKAAQFEKDRIESEERKATLAVKRRRRKKEPQPIMEPESASKQVGEYVVPKVIYD